MKKIIIFLFLFVTGCISGYSNKIDYSDEGGWVVQTSNCNYLATKLDYLPDTHEWIIEMQKDNNDKPSTYIIPCKSVKIYNMDGEITEEMAKNWKN